MFIHAQDLETFKRILHRDDVPEKIAQKYAGWILAFHSNGHSGPLGTLGIICLLDSCGHAFPPPAPPQPSCDWSRVKKGQPVEGQVDGKWLPAEFVCFGDLNQLVLRFKHDNGRSIDREVPRSKARIPPPAADRPNGKPPRGRQNQGNQGKPEEPYLDSEGVTTALDPAAA